MEGPWSIATWNVNSIKMRSTAVAAWLRAAAPDLLAIQELKSTEDGYPRQAFEEIGYLSAVHGQKTWNGVSILSRAPLDDIRRGLPEMEDDPQARFVSTRAGETAVVNVYVPNGAEVGSDKYAYKLRWLDALARHIEARYRPDDRLVIVGDFNIAPDERDIHDPEAFKDQVLFSEPERAALGRLLDWGLVDLFRRFHDEGGLYSWWDYRMAAFRRNLGARIDLILATKPLADRAISCEIDVAPRKLEKPSDHTPVLARFAG